MRLTAKEFLKRFPEFAGLTTEFIERILDEAKLELDSDLWGNKYTSGVFYLAADKIALSPVGEPARLAQGDGTTLYRREFERLAKTLGFAMVVV